MNLRKLTTWAVVPAAMTLAVATAAAAQSAVHVKLKSGSTYVGANDLMAGTSVIEVGSGSARNMTFTDLGFNSDGEQERITFSNGNIMASNTNCDGVTIKSDRTAFGTVWLEHFDNGNLYLWNRGCRDSRTDGRWRLAGVNITGRQWTLCDASAGNGCFIKITLVGA